MFYYRWFKDVILVASLVVKKIMTSPVTNDSGFPAFFGLFHHSVLVVIFSILKFHGFPTCSSPNNPNIILLVYILMLIHIITYIYIHIISICVKIYVDVYTHIPF